MSSKATSESIFISCNQIILFRYVENTRIHWREYSNVDYNNSTSLCFYV